MQLGGFGAPICRCDADAQVFGRSLGVLDRNIPIPVLIEHAGVEELELGPLSGTMLVLFDEPGDVMKVVCMLLIVAGIVGLKLSHP